MTDFLAACMFTCQVPNCLHAKCSSCMIDLGFCAKQSGCCILQKQPTTTKAGLAVGAIGLAAVALFQEAEIVLEVLGAAAAGNFALKRLLFAQDREKTFTEIK